MDKSDRMGLSPDDEKRIGFLSEEEEDEDDAGSVVVVSSDIVDSGVTGPVGYNYTRKLAFLCFGPVSKFYSPILLTGGSMNLSMEERKNGSRAAI